MNTRSTGQTTRRGRDPEVRPAYPNGRRAAESAAPAETATPARELSPLEQRVEELKREFASRQWDLGGLTYEMAARNHFTIEVLRRSAAELQRVDAELGEATRLVQIENVKAGGECPGCGSLYGKGAFYCWHCGQPLGAGAE